MSWKSEFAIYLLYVISNPLIIGVIITFVDDTFLLVTLDFLLPQIRNYAPNMIQKRK